MSGERIIDGMTPEERLRVGMPLPGDLEAFRRATLEEAWGRIDDQVIRTGKVSLWGDGLGALYKAHFGPHAPEVKP